MAGNTLFSGSTQLGWARRITKHLSLAFMETWWGWSQAITGGDGNLQFAGRAKLCNEIMHMQTHARKSFTCEQQTKTHTQSLKCLTVWWQQDTPLVRVLVAAPPLSSREGPRAPIPSLEKDQLTASGEIHGNQQPGRRSIQVLVINAQMTWLTTDKSSQDSGSRNMLECIVQTTRLIHQQWRPKTLRAVVGIWNHTRQIKGN